MKSQKISITLPGDLLDYSNARKAAFDSLSAYIQYLIEQERSGKVDDEPHTTSVLDEISKIWKTKRKKDPSPFIAVREDVAIASAMSYQHGEILWKQIAEWSAGWEKHDLSHIWLVLPDDCFESDLVNFTVLAKNKVLPSVGVLRLKDLEDFLG